MALRPSVRAPRGRLRREVRPPMVLALLAALLAVLLAGPTTHAQRVAEFSVSHVKTGWPWKIPLAEGKGEGIVFLLGIDNRVTAYDLASGTAVWSFQMGLGQNEYLFNQVPVLETRGKRLTHLLDDRGYLHALDVQTGIARWRTYDRDRFLFPPVCVSGWVMMVSEQGWLYKLDARTGQGMRAKDPNSKVIYREKKVIARPTVIRDSDEKRPAFIACLTEARPGERELVFVDFSSHRVDERFSAKIEERELNESPISSPLFSTGYYSTRGASTMRVFIAARRGANEIIYQKDFSNIKNPFTLFYKLRNGRLCEEPTFNQDGYMILPNTSGHLYVLRPDGKEMKSIRCSNEEGAMSVKLLEDAAASYGVMVVQSADSLASYQLNLENRLGGFNRFYPFKVVAWPVMSTRADAQWKDNKSKFIGEPRLPLHMISDKMVLTSQVEDTAFLSVYPRSAFLERGRKSPPKEKYARSTKPGGSEFLSFDLVDDGRRMLVGYGDLGTYVIDARRPRVLHSNPLKTRLAVGTAKGHLVFSQNEDDGIFLAMLSPDLTRAAFKQPHLADEVVARPVVAGNRVYFVTRSVLYARDLTAAAEPVSVPTRAVSPLLYHKGCLVVGTRSGYLDCFDTKDMRKKWSFRVRGTVKATPTVAGKELFFGTTEGVIYALPWENAAGRFNRSDASMEYELRNKGEVYAPPLLHGKMLYVAASPSRGKTILSQIDVSSRETPQEVWKAPVIGEVRLPMVRHQDLLLLAASERIVALQISGERPQKLWEEKLADSVASPMQIKGSDLYFLCRDGSIYCLELKKEIF